MASAIGQKRKALTASTKIQKKSARAVSHSPSAESEDMPVAGPSIYDDPMIDPTDSEEDDEDFDDVEDDDVEDFGGDEEINDAPAAGPSRPATTSTRLYKPPTLEEMDQLRNVSTEGGTTFSLQLDALLGSTLLSTTPAPALKNILSTLHSHILSLKELPPLPPRKAVARLNGEAVPFVGPAEFSPLRKEGEEGKWGLGWERPEEVIVGGSWPVVGGYKKGKGQAGAIDLVVVMPSSSFSPKDRLSYRYFHKRTYYLAVILASLRKLVDGDGALQGADVDWSITGGDARRSAIVITAGKGLKNSTEIHIHAAVSPGTFSLSTLQPSKSLLRHDSIPAETATPLYSASILLDTLHKSYLLHVHRLSTTLTAPRCVDSFLALWRIWAARRGIARDRGASGWLASMILGWVVEGGDVGGSSGDRSKVKRNRGLGKGLGSWQAIRAAWEFLANTDFAKTPIFLGQIDEEPIPRSDILNAFEDVMVDPTGSVNIFAGWNKGEIGLLRYHARETLAMLEDSSIDRFADVFLRDISFGPHAFDEYLEVDISACTASENLIDVAERLARAERLSGAVEAILRRGLSDRIRLLSVRASSETTLKVGLIYDPSNATRVLDVGPSSTKTEETNAFRALWGDQAELRRFKDGSISESVVWSITRPEEATLIPSRIVAYLLQRHFGLQSDAITISTSDIEWPAIVQTPATARDAICITGSERLGFRPMMDAYDDLYKLLKSIDDELPLAILSVQPASEFLRYSSTFVPHPVDLNRYPSSPDCLKYLPTAEIIFQFESSPRWPDDLAAIQKVKLAMFEKIARVIMAQRKGTKVGIVFDSSRNEMEDRAALEIITIGGIAFKARIYHEREKALLERIIEGETQTFGTALPQPPRRLAVPALELHIRQFVHLPQHHGALAPLHHRYPSYSSATRLLKRWFAAHMLSSLIPAEAVELIMAKVYLEPGSLSQPSSAVTGFIRAIDLLSSWDWRREPLFVPVLSLNTGDGSRRIRFPEDQRREATSHFEAGHKADVDGKHAGWTVFTESDLEGRRWTRGITPLIAGRVRVLARATSESLKASTGQINVKALFTSPTTDYDVLLHLDPSILTRYAQAVSPDEDHWAARLKHRNVHQGVFGEDVKAAFDPALALVSDIQRLYGDSLLVFYDVHGGAVIGLLWNPIKSNPRALKPFLGYNVKPAKQEAALVQIDRASILGEISRMGRGLISSITSK